MKLTIPEQRGTCRWCGCTELNACVGGCAWADGTQTLCTECVALDTKMRSAEGRRDLATLTHVSTFALLLSSP